MKFELTNEPDVESYLIEIEGLPPGTKAKMSVSAKTAAGPGPAATVDLIVAPAKAVVPGTPVIVAVDAEPPLEKADPPAEEEKDVFSVADLPFAKAPSESSETQPPESEPVTN